MVHIIAQFMPNTEFNIPGITQIAHAAFREQMHHNLQQQEISLDVGKNMRYEFIQTKTRTIFNNAN